MKLFIIELSEKFCNKTTQFNDHYIFDERIFNTDLNILHDSYFTQTAPLLMSDPTLYCVSAWYDLARDDSGGDPSVVMRSETMAGLGWLLSRNVYQALIKKWPAHDKVSRKVGVGS